MKIAFIVDSFPKLSETFIVNQIIGLLDRGHEVEIFADRVNEESKVHADIANYGLVERTRYFNVPSSRYARALSIFPLTKKSRPTGLARLLKSFKATRYNRHDIFSKLVQPHMLVAFPKEASYDIIHCHFGLNGLRGMMLKELGVMTGKVITSFHGRDINLDPIKYGLDLYSDLFKEGDLFTINSSYTKEKASRLGCPDKKLIKLPMGLNLTQYSYEARTYPERGKVKIVTVGRLTEKKGIAYSIQAITEVIREYPGKVEYQIVGDGDLRPDLERLIKDLKMEDSIKLLGWKTQEELRSIYQKSHIFVLSSVTASDGDQEGQGLVIQEAQAMGLPVVSTLHNGIPDGVCAGKTALLVPERDVAALRDALIVLMENAAIWPEMGLDGHRFVAKNYDMERLNDQLVQIYEEALD